MIDIMRNLKDDYVTTFSAIMHLALDEAILIKKHITMNFHKQPLTIKNFIVNEEIENGWKQQNEGKNICRK